MFMFLFVAMCANIHADCDQCSRPVTVSYTGSAVSVTYGADILCTSCSANNMVRSDGTACVAAMSK